MTRNHLTFLGFLTAIVVLVADQASKWWILNVLDLPDRPTARSSCCQSSTSPWCGTAA